MWKKAHYTMIRVGGGMAIRVRMAGNYGGSSGVGKTGNAGGRRRVPAIAVAQGMGSLLCKRGALTNCRGWGSVLDSMGRL